MIEKGVYVRTQFGVECLGAAHAFCEAARHHSPEMHKTFDDIERKAWRSHPEKVRELARNYWENPQL